MAIKDQMAEFFMLCEHLYMVGLYNPAPKKRKHK